VDGIFRLYESDVRQPVNLGNPQERSILEFAETIRKLIGGTSAIEKLPGREDDPKRRCPDITRARTLLGWSPQVDLETGLRDCLDYFRTQK
jgi:nucleoside-diphosphate-sugar epimerase